jgi:hypothetical protein
MWQPFKHSQTALPEISEITPREQPVKRHSSPLVIPLWLPVMSEQALQDWEQTAMDMCFSEETIMDFQANEVS